MVSFQHTCRMILFCYVHIHVRSQYSTSFSDYLVLVNLQFWFIEIRFFIHYCMYSMYVYILHILLCILFLTFGKLQAMLWLHIQYFKITTSFFFSSASLKNLCETVVKENIELIKKVNNNLFLTGNLKKWTQWLWRFFKCIHYYDKTGS